MWVMVFLNNFWFFFISIVGSFVLINFILYFFSILDLDRDIVRFNVVCFFMVGKIVFGCFFLIIFFIIFGMSGLM